MLSQISFLIVFLSFVGYFFSPFVFDSAVQKNTLRKRKTGRFERVDQTVHKRNPYTFFTCSVMANMKYTFGIAAACFLLVSPFFASADDLQNGISISPMFQEVVLDKDSPSKTFSLQASNTTDSLVTLRLSVLDFGSLDESGGVAFLGAEQNFEKQYSLASWIRLDRDALVLGPGESQTVEVTFENRESLSPGGHYGAIFFKMENSGADTVGANGKPNIAVSQSFSSLIFAKKLGGERYDLGAPDIGISKSFFFLPQSFSLRFQNKGNVHVVPRGTVTVTDPRGNMVEKGIINEESAIILPETFRTYVVRPSVFARSFLPGYYTATVQYRYDGNEDFASKNTRFFFMPWQDSALLLCGVAFLVWRRVKNRAEKKKTV